MEEHKLIAFFSDDALWTRIKSQCAWLMMSEARLCNRLSESEQLTEARGWPRDWAIGCEHHWNHVTAVLGRVHRTMVKIESSITLLLLDRAFNLLIDLVHHQERLRFAISGLQEQTAHLSETSGKAYNHLIELILEHQSEIEVPIQILCREVVEGRKSFNPEVLCRNHFPKRLTSDMA